MDWGLDLVGVGIGFELDLGKRVGREHTSSFSSSKYFFQRKFGPLGENPNCGYPNVLRSFLATEILSSTDGLKLLPVTVPKIIKINGGNNNEEH